MSDSEYRDVLSRDQLEALTESYRFFQKGCIKVFTWCGRREPKDYVHLNFRVFVGMRFNIEIGILYGFIGCETNRVEIMFKGEILYYN